MKNNSIFQSIRNLSGFWKFVFVTIIFVAPWSIVLFILAFLFFDEKIETIKDTLDDMKNERNS